VKLFAVKWKWHVTMKKYVTLVYDLLTTWSGKVRTAPQTNYEGRSMAEVNKKRDRWTWYITVPSRQLT